VEEGGKNMSIGMSAQEIEDFLSDGHTARIATVKSDNSSIRLNNSMWDRVVLCLYCCYLSSI